MKGKGPGERVKGKGSEKGEAEGKGSLCEVWVAELGVGTVNCGNRAEQTPQGRQSREVRIVSAWCNPTVSSHVLPILPFNLFPTS